MGCFPKNSIFRKYMTGYMLVLLVDMAYTVSVISAQLSMADTPLFEPNCIKFAVTTTVSFCLLLLFNDSFKVEHEHIYMIIVIGICDYIYSTCYYVSAIFMPVGNLEGVFVAMWIISTTVVDLVRQRVKHRAIAAALLASVGIFLMVQPWRTHSYVVDIRRRAPCDSMTWSSLITNDTHHYPDVKPFNETHPKFVGLERQEQLEHNKGVFSFMRDDTTNTTEYNTDQYSTRSAYDPSGTQVANTTTMGPYMQLETSKHAVAYGYLLVAVAAMAATATGNMAQNLMASYSVATLTFWIGLFEGIISVILTCAFENYPGIGGWTLPAAKYCLIFTFIYIVFSGVMDLSTYYTYKFLPISQVVILLSLTIMTLYLCQRTFLFNDGNANAYELIGVLCTFSGAALSPFFTLFQKKARYEELK